MKEVIKQKLIFLEPFHLDIKNISYMHAGHKAVQEIADNGGEIGETHFEIEIVSSEFLNKSKINRHRIINQALNGIIGEQVHSISVKAYDELEWKIARA